MTRKEVNDLFAGDGWFDAYGKQLIDLLLAKPLGLTLYRMVELTGLKREVALEALRKLAAIDMVDNRSTIGARGLTLYQASDAAKRSIKDRRERPQQRLCLSCETAFFSSHAGNRICQRCKEADSFDRPGAMAI